MGKSVYDVYIHEMTITVISTCTWTQKYVNFSFVIWDHPSYLISLSQMNTRKLKTPCRNEKLKVHYEIQKLFGSIIYIEFWLFFFTPIIWL